MADVKAEYVGASSSNHQHHHHQHQYDEGDDELQNGSTRDVDENESNEDRSYSAAADVKDEEADEEPANGHADRSMEDGEVDNNSVDSTADSDDDAGKSAAKKSSSSKKRKHDSDGEGSDWDGDAAASAKKAKKKSKDKEAGSKKNKKVKKEKKDKKKSKDDKKFKSESDEEEEEEDYEEEDDGGSDWSGGGGGGSSKKKAKDKKKAKSSSSSSKDSKVKTKTKKDVKDVKVKAENGTSPSSSPSKKKKKTKEEDEEHVWKWWEEKDFSEDIKWRTLEHHGPLLAPPYERLPSGVRMSYDGKPMKLSEGCEEVASFYGKMLDHEYTSKDVFNKNFFKDWKKFMTPEEKATITDLKKCDFRAINEYFKVRSEERKNRSKEEKNKEKEKNEKLRTKYGMCIVDGHKQKIANYNVEPPGLFRGRGEHPKMGKVKRRVQPEEIIINIGKKATVPEPPKGHRWKEIRHDNTVTWLASWTENIMGGIKYIMLNPSSAFKSVKDWKKYETARALKKHVDKIRGDYREDFKSKEMLKRQRAVALYLIDHLALRAGNEKEEGETADTVGCCSLRVEHIKLHETTEGGEENVVEFDFLGKDSIRYQNSVPVEKRVFKNLRLFMENKAGGDDLFDRLTTSSLNKYLNTLMDGLTAKVFRTYNASKTLQEQLTALTKEDMGPAERVLAYNRANRAVAILCNHQRSVPKTFETSMANLEVKIKEKKKQIKDQKVIGKNAEGQVAKQKAKKRMEQLKDQLLKLEVQRTDKEENKQIALGTSKLNYLDPRISVAWCKKWDIPIEKVYNKTQREKFRWAIEMADKNYKF